MKIISNKKGWLEIIEAFVAVLLVAGILLIILNKGSLQKTDISDQVYNVQVSIIREIQTNDTLRKDINGAGEPPIDWEGGNFPPSVKEKISQRTPNYLQCIAKICCIEEDVNCLDGKCSLSKTTLDEIKGKDIYSQSGVISPTTISEGAIYRKLNLFCWAK